MSGFWASSPTCEKWLLVSSCLSVCLSVCLSFYPFLRVEQISSHWTDFHEIWYLIIFSQICLEYPSFIKIWQEWRDLYKETNIHFYLISFSFC
jgi:hypothetical protein